MGALKAFAGKVGLSGIDAAIGGGRSKLSWSRTKRMMKNRHQWEVADLKAAGLNPILSAGSAPSMGSPQMAPPSDFSDAADTAVKSKQDTASRKNLKAQRGQIALQLGLIRAQTAKEATTADVNTAQAASIRANTRRWGPFSDLGAMGSELTGPASRGERSPKNLATGVGTIMGGNADAARKAHAATEAQLKKLKRELVDYLRKNGLINDKWSDNWRNTK